MRARENPFRSERIDALAYRPQTLAWRQIVERLDALGGHGAIVGPHGSGKSTLLRRLGIHLRERGLVVERLFLNDRAPRPSFRKITELAERSSSRTAFLLDGAEQLSLPRWLAVRHAGAFIVTAHRDGRLPCLVETETSLALLKELAAALTRPSPPPGDAVLEHLHRKYGGNVRDAFFALYDSPGY